MKLEDQVCSLELAKRLKELGVPQKSLFYWVRRINALEYGQALGKSNKEGEIPCKEFDKLGKWEILYKNDKDCKDYGFGFYSAPTIAELGEGLPPIISIYDYNGHKLFNLEITRAIEKGWFVRYTGDLYSLKECYDDTLVNAVTKMFIYLIENGLVKI